MFNPHFATVWIEAEGAPDSFFERFEIEQRAKKLARAHFAAYDKLTDGGDVLLHLAGLLLHPFGIHEWVRILVYDPRVDRIIDPGRGRVICRNCDR